MGNLCDKSIHISVLLIVLCAGVLCGLIFYILIGYGGKWGRAAINFYGYDGMNVFGFDMGGGYWPWNWNLFQ